MEVNQFIAGSFRSGRGREVQDLNPSDTREVLATFLSATKEDTLDAVRAAEAAFPAWKKTPAPARGRILLRAWEIFSSRKHELALLLAREEGKTTPEALGEIQKGLNVLEYYAGEGFRLEGTTYPSEMPGNFGYTLRQPLGVVSVITPWNFPFAIPVWKTAPALVAGNTVVLKPASLTPLLAQEIAKGFAEAGLPSGVLNVIYGSGAEVGDVLVDAEPVKALSFTGSTETGGYLHHRLSRRFVKETYELGGQNAVAVLVDADLDLAARGIVDGAFGSTGQRCTATRRVIVEKAVMEPLKERIVELAKNLKIGRSWDEGVQVGPAVDQSQLEKNLAAILKSQEEGARLLFGGQRVSAGDLAHGHFMAPAVFDQVRPGMTLAHEEVFGPVLGLMEADSLDEVIHLSNSVAYGLSSSVYGRDLTRIQTFIDEAEVGMVHVNNPTVGGEAQIPFGGIKASGLGHREMSKEGVLFFTELKTVFVDYTGAPRTTKFY